MPFAWMMFPDADAAVQAIGLYPMALLLTTAAALAGPGLTTHWIFARYD